MPKDPVSMELRDLVYKALAERYPDMKRPSISKLERQSGSTKLVGTANFQSDDPAYPFIALFEYTPAAGLKPADLYITKDWID